MTFISHFDKLQISPCLFPGFQNFHVLNLNCKRFKLYLQNTLNMLKMTRVYFGVLQVGTFFLHGHTETTPHSAVAPAPIMDRTQTRIIRIEHMIRSLHVFDRL